LSTLIAIIIIGAVFLAAGGLYSIFKTQLKFIVTGLDAGFSISDVILLWKVANMCELEEQTSVYFSLPALTKCMTQISNDNDPENPDKNQKIMTKLFNYRTKLQNESDERRGLQSTKSLDKGQRLRIILPGKGVFASEIMNNGSQMIITIPKQHDMIPVTAEEWVNKVVSVYLWRKGDARYVFDSVITQSGLFIGKPALYLKHSNELTRTQKRKTVRAKCEIYGDLYIIRKPTVDYTAVETQNGYKCLIEDISESGALIRIGGKGAENVQIKLQYTIQNMLIVMFGVIRTVEYNEAENQSLLHFECIHIEEAMKNEILKYVYQILPEAEKEILEALEQTDQDNPEELSAELEKEVKEGNSNSEVVNDFSNQFDPNSVFGDELTNVGE